MQCMRYENEVDKRFKGSSKISEIDDRFPSASSNTPCVAPNDQFSSVDEIKYPKERPKIQCSNCHEPREWESPNTQLSLHLNSNLTDVSPIHVLQRPLESKSVVPSVPKLSNPPSLHERKVRYEQRRKEIFANVDSIAKVDLPKNSVVGVRQRFRLWRTVSKNIAETLLDKPSDMRKYALVKINGKSIEGLLDSGASITCLGRGSHNFLESLGLSITLRKSKVKTANGTSAEIIGSFKAEVSFKGFTRELLIFVAPNLTQNLYLGVDFWNSFKLWPSEISENLEKSHKRYEKCYNLRSRPVKFHQGQEVFKRNVILSDKNKHINAKLCPKFMKCKVRNVLAENRYELETEKGKFLGIYHAQDIRA
uniref:Peptidase A2 domain-containing protein n=1 Tax=Megaselia scalaris TaxID=36166 RepID=T1GXX3_MEGSC